MDERDLIAEQFEAHRNHLRAVALRLLGSPADADDALQEAWLHLTRGGAAGVENLRGWLATIVARICLDMLRSRLTRRQTTLDEAMIGASDDGPEDEAILADSVGLALQVVLDRLTPAERVAFVLHDVFDVPFEDIAVVVGRTPTAARQLASRARRRVKGSGESLPDVDRARQREVVSAFLAAAHAGDFEALVAVLDPAVVLRSDGAAVRLGAPQEARGAAVAAFLTRARDAVPALIDGRPGVAWAPGGQLRVAHAFTIEHGKIATVDLIADPERLRQLEVVILPD